MGTGLMAHRYGPKINAHPGLSMEVICNPAPKLRRQGVDAIWRAAVG